MNKIDLGKVLITPKGDYSSSVQYEALDVIRYQNGSYLVLKTVTGVTPSDDKINYQLLAEDGTDGGAGIDGFSPIVQTSQIIGGNSITITDKTGPHTFTVKDGKNGKDGNDGNDGTNGTNGRDGTNGIDGQPGADGKSAYQIAVDNGYQGTEAEWIESISGSKPIIVTFAQTSGTEPRWIGTTSENSLDIVKHIEAGESVYAKIDLTDEQMVGHPTILFTEVAVLHSSDPQPKTTILFTNSSMHGNVGSTWWYFTVDETGGGMLLVAKTDYSDNAPYYVHYSTSTQTADRTLDEILAAIDGGRQAIAIVDLDGGDTGPWHMVGVKLICTDVTTIVNNFGTRMVIFKNVSTPPQMGHDLSHSAGAFWFDLFFSEYGTGHEFITEFVNDGVAYVDIDTKVSDTEFTGISRNFVPWQRKRLLSENGYMGNAIMFVNDEFNNEVCEVYHYTKYNYVDETNSTFEFERIYLKENENIVSTIIINYADGAVTKTLTKLSSTGPAGKDGVDGTNGVDGKTPVKGVDYYTEEDKAQMVQDVIAALPIGDEVKY